MSRLMLLPCSFVFYHKKTWQRDKKPKLDIAIEIPLKGQKLTKHTDVTGAICRGNLV